MGSPDPTARACCPVQRRSVASLGSHRLPPYSASMRILVGVLPLEGVDEVEYDPRYYAWMTSEYLVDDFTEVLSSELFAKCPE